MALGGDETGIMKAKEVTKVAGSMRSSGLVFVLRANSAKMGTRIEEDATLEATYINIRVGFNHFEISKALYSRLANKTYPKSITIKACNYHEKQ